jgi:hypothetical protein
MSSDGLLFGLSSGSKEFRIDKIYRWFDLFIMICIVANAVVLSLFDF